MGDYYGEGQGNEGKKSSGKRDEAVMWVEVKFLGDFINGFKWGSKKYIRPDETIVDIVGATKKSLHIVPKGGTMRDRISVPKGKIKIIRQVGEPK